MIMSKLAFSTLSFEKYSAAELVDLCKKYGFAGLEIRVLPDAVIHYGMEASEIKEISQLFSHEGIAVTDIGTGVHIKGTGADISNGMLEEFSQAVRIAQIMKAKGIRIFLGNYFPRLDSPRDTIDYFGIIERVKSLCSIANENGTEVWVETHNEFSTGRMLKRVWDDVEADNLKFIWDLIHPLEDHESPEATLRLIGNQCAHVHVKDGMPFDDPLMYNWKYTGIGEGIVPMEHLYALLQGNGFDGFYSLEWESRWYSDLRGLKYEKERVLGTYAAHMGEIVRRQG